MAKKTPGAEALAEAEAELARQRRMIRVVNETGIGKDTQILRLDGEDITAALKLTRVELDLSVGNLAQAVLHVIALHGEVTAEVVRIEKEILPPPKPKTQLKLIVSAPRIRWGRRRSFYLLQRFVPVHAFADTPDVEYGGAIVTELASGRMAPIGPLVLTVDE